MPTYVSLDPEAYGEGTEFEAADDDAAVQKARADLRAIVGGDDDGPDAEFAYVLYRQVPDADLAEFQPMHERDEGSNWYELALQSGDYLVLDQSRVFKSICEGLVVCKSADTIEAEADAERERQEDRRRAAEAEREDADSMR